MRRSTSGVTVLLVRSTLRRAFCGLWLAAPLAAAEPRVAVESIGAELPWGARIMLPGAVPVPAALRELPGEPPSATFAVIGDGGRDNGSMAGIRKSLQRSGVRRLILPGDNLYHWFRSYGAVWDEWTDAGFSFEAVAIGNHNRGYPREIAYFDMPGEYYRKDYGGLATVLVLNSDNEELAAEQAAWLSLELERSQAGAVFLVYHHPPYSVSSDHTGSEKRRFHEATRPVILRHRGKLTAVLLGHDHVASLVHAGDLPMIVSGATARPRASGPVDCLADGLPVKTAWMHAVKKDAIWVRLDVSPLEPGARARFIRARDDRALCTVRLTSGSAARLEPNCSR